MFFRKKPKPPDIEVIRDLPESDPESLLFLPESGHGYFVGEDGQHYYVGFSFQARGHTVGVAVRCDPPESTTSRKFIYETDNEEHKHLS